MDRHARRPEGGAPVTTHALSVGDRVRVGENEVSAKYVGALGTIDQAQDKFGRWGVRLDDFPRKHKHWLHWFVPEVLHRVGEEKK